MLKKIWKFLSSMQFAILLLVILAAACAVGSFITQGQTFAYYAQAYSERAAALILATHMDDLYHSPGFLALAGFLVCNLLACNLVRLPQLIRRFRAEADAEKALSGPVSCTVAGVKPPEALFSALMMPAPKAQTVDGKKVLFASRHRVGLWGAWVCHLGILLLILGFGLGQMMKEEYTLYGVPGQSRQVGETNYICTIDAFSVDLREDDTVAQYRADITVRDAASGGSRSAEISVNNPATLFGYKFYQNSTGWAAKVTVTKAGAPLQEEILCAGESLSVLDLPDLVLHFNAFYPDYVFIEGKGPATASGALKHPAYLYTLSFQNQLLGMNALEGEDVITVDDYEIRFSEPQNYTLLQIKRDPFTPLALLGGLVTLLGLVLAFYLQPRKVWALQEEDGNWTVSGFSPKGGVLFREEMEKAAEEAAHDK